MNNYFKIKLLILFAILFTVDSVVFAAGVELKTENNYLQRNEIFVVSMILNTENESVNTIEGYIEYDKDKLKAEAVNIGHSLINLWMEKPNTEKDGSIRFSGITPGGVSVPMGEVFNVVFRAKDSGASDILLRDLNIYLNDGLATKAKVKTGNLGINTSDKNSSNGEVTVFSNDKNQPERFKSIRSRDDYTYEGKYFLSFNPIDKDSGLSHVLVCEFLSCNRLTSPALLSNQTPFYFIRVIAFDMNGNSTTSYLVSNYLYSILFIAVLLFVFLYFKNKKVR